MGNQKKEDQKTFTVLLTKSWFIDGQKIKVGESLSDIMSGKPQVIEFKEILIGDKFKTFKIVIDKEDKIYLMKSNKELK